MRALALLFALALIGCAATSQVQPYRPRGSDAAAWSISGRADYGATSNTVTILVDGVPVASGPVSAWDGSGNVFGEHQGHKINAACRTEHGYQTAQHVCQVMVDGELAANLQF